jgi:hypothetical protein
LLPTDRYGKKQTAEGMLVIGFRYLTGAWRRDTLLITPDTVLLSQQKGFHKTQQSFSRAAITGLRFLDEPEETPHPLGERLSITSAFRRSSRSSVKSSQTQSYIVQAAEDMRLSVDGTTDGWYDHQQALKALLVRYEDQLTISQQTQLKELITFVQDVIGRS